jgi:HPt (histidine-containing phosphotransfer) domain-containing protein
MTSYDREADKERCLASGMDDYLTKGVNAASLSRVIERVCDKSKQQGSSDSLDGLQSETEPFDAATMKANYTQEELNEVVRLFLTAMETFVNSMQKAIDSRDGALVASLASSIKGPSATLGLPLITKVSNDILSFSEAEDWPQVRLKYLKLKTVYMRSQDQLRKLCPDVFAEGVL